MKKCYRDHYRVYRVHLAIIELRQSGTIQDFLNEIKRHNAYAKVSESAILNIIIHNLSIKLRDAIAHYEHLYSQPKHWTIHLMQMDTMTAEFQEQDKFPRLEKK